MRTVVLLLVAGLWLGAAAGAGRAIARAIGLDAQTRLEEGIISLHLGYALASYLVFLLGSAGLVRPAMPWVVLAILVALARPWRLRSLRGWPSGRARASLVVGPPQTGRGSMALAAVCAVIAGLTLVGALAPPTEWDTITYHLAAPAYYVMQSRIAFIPYRDWANPFVAEMWNVMGLLMGFESLPQVFQWTMGAAGAAALYLLASARMGHPVGMLAATMYYAAPEIVRLSTTAKSDLVWLGFVFLSLHAMLVWREQGRERWLWGSAVFSGLAVSTKYHGLFWLPAIVAVLLMVEASSLRRWPGRTVLRFVGYAGIILAVALPWYGRNWLAGGDPLWPNGYDLFQSRFWTPELHAKYASWTQGPGKSIGLYLMGLWNLALNEAAWLFGVRIPSTPLLVAFLPPLAVLWPRVPLPARTPLVPVIAASAVYYTLWFATYQHPRYVAPTLALLGIPAALAFHRLHDLRASRTVAMALLASTLAFFLAYAAIYNLQFAPVVVGKESRAAFLRRYVSFFDDMEWLNANLPRDARVMAVHLRTFYLRRDFIRGDRNLWPGGAEGSADDYLRLMKSRGITHVFLPRADQPAGGLLHDYRLLDELKARGLVVPVHVNPMGVEIESRTLGQFRRVPVEILRLEPTR
jgi:hypothetical protein